MQNKIEPVVEEKSIFDILSKINVSKYIEKKGGLSYLSWSSAWSELKKIYPRSKYIIYENEKGWNYYTDEKTAWVKVGVEVEGLNHIEYLPVMDFRNKSITVDKITSFDVNKAIQRCLTKAIARHGLGLYIYNGEDLPEEEEVKRTKDKDEFLFLFDKKNHSEVTVQWDGKQCKFSYIAENIDKAPDDLVEIALPVLKGLL